MLCRRFPDESLSILSRDAEDLLDVVDAPAKIAPATGLGSSQDSVHILEEVAQEALAADRFDRDGLVLLVGVELIDLVGVGNPDLADLDLLVGTDARAMEAAVALAPGVGDVAEALELPAVLDLDGLEADRDRDVGGGRLGIEAGSKGSDLSVGEVDEADGGEGEVGHG